MVVVIAGGDGSLMRIALDMGRANIDVNKVVFTVLPFGTGNDLSQQLGWGGTARALTPRSDALR